MQPYEHPDFMVSTAANGNAVEVKTGYNQSVSRRPGAGNQAAKGVPRSCHSLSLLRQFKDYRLTVGVAKMLIDPKISDHRRGNSCRRQNLFDSRVPGRLPQVEAAVA